MAQAEASRYDAIIIGAGQAGMPLSTALAKAGRSTALIEREHVGGACMKAIVDAETDRILGWAVLGIEVGELMAMMQIAMMGEVPASVLREAIFAHPTLAESLNTLFVNLQE